MLPHNFYCRCHRLAGMLVPLLAPLALIGCGSVPLSSPSASQAASPSQGAPSSLPVLPPAGSGRGAYYMDDGPGDAPPEGLLAIPDAEPRIEPYPTRGNRPYVVFGKSYTPFTDGRPYKARGIASWYGKKFHGQKTSSGELYDMYKMTAAHPTLPLPSYARVTNLASGKQVIVRVNDRGPFHAGRIIDLSYTAALKLGYLGKGSAQVEVERLLPEEIMRMTAARQQEQAVADSAAAQAEQGLSAEPALVSSAPAASGPASAAGFYLQLGAYTRMANAEAAGVRLATGAAVALPPMEVIESGELYRLYSGPFMTRADAAIAAQRLKEAAALTPMIVQR